MSIQQKEVNALILRTIMQPNNEESRAKLMVAFAEGIATLAAAVDPSPEREYALGLTLDGIRKRVSKLDEEVAVMKQAFGGGVKFAVDIDLSDRGEDCGDPGCPVHGVNPLPDELLEKIGGVLKAFAEARK